MSKDLKLFQEKQIRTAWNDAEQEWYFSIVDVIAALTDSHCERQRPCGNPFPLSAV
ncbi:MAG: hypothetical protein Q4B40_07505 [Clostridia bacterium]|nr:hypothetical protein [Clostridia bacterium]